MKNVLVTGSNGFIGRNLVQAMRRIEGVSIYEFDIGDNASALGKYLREADFIFHLAGVNRPDNIEEYDTGNAGFTGQLVHSLISMNRRVPVLLSSSIQADGDTSYGLSKRKAEAVLREYHEESGAPVYVYRLANVFGKWCRPNYNSVVSTFCNNLAHDRAIEIHDCSREIELVYIDDVVASFIGVFNAGSERGFHSLLSIEPSFRITLGELAARLQEIRLIRKSSVVPDMSDRLTRYLYATYLTYLDEDNLAYGLGEKRDQRGVLAELLRSAQFGQIFVSRTHAGFVRGNHYHDTKIEKFCVLQGQAIVRLRHVRGGKVLEYPVSGDALRIVDIPPGYTHSIENVGDREITVLFWAGEMFDTKKPDTYSEEV